MNSASATGERVASRPHAYGFAIAGLPLSDALSVIDPGPSPALTITKVGDRYTASETNEILEDRAVLHWAYGTTVVERDTMSVAFHSVVPLPDSDIVHPGLWPAAAIAARWIGRETLHGGGVLDASGGAWVILGDSGSGKSSLLGSLALAGEPVLADDLVVTEGDYCFAGPRCVDLLPDAADRLCVGDRTEAVRSSHRQRLALGPIAARLPLRGFIYLAWDDRLAVERLEPADRLARLAAQRRVAQLGVDPVAFLDLGRLPAMTLRRPRDWASMPEATRLLMSALA